MISKKNQGNNFYNQQKYLQAIQCYKQFIKHDHYQNYTAYNNMALSYYKLKNYKQCINACQKALQLNPQNGKSYYRMYQASRQLNDYYNMIIYGLQFCKYSKLQTQITQIKKKILLAKTKFTVQHIKTTKFQQTNKFFYQIIKSDSINQQISIKKQYHQLDIGQKWKIVEQNIEQNKRQGTNEAYLFISRQCKTNQDLIKYRQLLKIARNRQTSFKIINKVVQIEKERQIYFPQISQIKHVQSRSEIDLQQIQMINLQQTQEIDLQQTQEINLIKTQMPFLIQTQMTHLQKNQDILKKIQPSQSKFIAVQSKPIIFQQNVYKPTQVQLNVQQQTLITQLYIKQVEAKMQLSKLDMFATFYSILDNIITSSQYNVNIKIGLLKLIPKKLKSFNILRNSYSSKQKRLLLQLARQQQVIFILNNQYFKK